MTVTSMIMALKFPTYFKLCTSHMVIQLLLVQHIYVKVFKFHVPEETSDYL